MDTLVTFRPPNPTPTPPGHKAKRPPIIHFSIAFQDFSLRDSRKVSMLMRLCCPSVGGSVDFCYKSRKTIGQHERFIEREKQTSDNCYP
jgi:hypothetical protein